MDNDEKIRLWDIFSKCSFIQEYKDNIENPNVGSGRQDGVRIPYKDIMSSLKPEDWVRMVFKWADTPQGHDYWQEVRKGWDNFLATKGYSFSIISKWYIDPEKERYLNILKRCSFFRTINEYVEDEQHLRRLVAGYCVDEWIGCFFEWKITKEGKEFWQEVNGCWERFVNTGEEEWIKQWLDKGDVATTGLQGAGFTVTLPKAKAMTVNFKL